MTTLLIQYSTGVFTPAGWRSVTVTAKATQTGAGTATVDIVTALDGKAPHGTHSRTGAKRQAYYAPSIARREEGARKRLSACTILETLTA